MRTDSERLASALAEITTLKAENDRLRSLLGLDRPLLAEPAAAWEPTLFAESKVEKTPAPDSGPLTRSAKVALYRSLFVGRDDVHSLRWENTSGKSGWSPAVKGGWPNARKPAREYLPLTDEVVEAHLSGRSTVGLYPLLPGDHCRLLACDFDGSSWTLDALAYVEVCRERPIPAVLERSSSGDGAHVWVFFAGNVAASVARTIGACMLRAAMELRAEIDLASYDRLFPAQDFMPKGSFGNLIALPLQGTCRRSGTTVFLDPSTLELFDDQWAFLATVPKLSVAAATAIANATDPFVLGPGTRLRATIAADRPIPPIVRARFGAMLSIERIGTSTIVHRGVEALGVALQPRVLRT